MTATTLAAPAAAVGAASRPSDATTVRRQTLGTAIRSEWVKLRTLRSTWVGLGSTLLVLVGFGAIAAAVSTGSVATPEGGGGGGGPFGGSDPVSTVLMGANFAVLLMGILGALAGAREYGSRMIAATVAAVPRRWQVVVAKATVFTGVSLAVSVIGVLAAFTAGMGVLSGGDAATVALTDDGVLRQVLGMAGYITAVGLIGMGLGILLRSVAGSIGAVVAVFMVLPPLAGALLPDSWDPILQYLPGSAAAAFTTVRAAGTEVLGAGAGAVVLAAWVLVALGGAVVAITRRDV
ncbi:ABC transporter permease [Cellulomonas sp. KRMCY2]|uniref:ABC transporter permease n=1 Tax=Cellulomonas sp. KRMCY2 TaxID=1304865 RepID=UPI00045E7352|nr:ABC transporter permease [Cellulomonas sp. KRMCY2]